LKFFYRYIIFLFLLSVAYSLTSCHKDSAVPVYLDIQPFELITNKTTEGANSSKITDVWVYVNQQSLGAYTLPCKIPVISEGKMQVLLAPGILKDASLVKRLSYPFYQAFIDTIDFVKGNTYTIHPTTKYTEGNKYYINEGFEVGSGFTKRMGDTSIIKINDNAVVTEPYLDKYVGKITLDATHDTMQIISAWKDTIPASGNVAYIELDYKCDIQFTVGLLVSNASGVFEYWHATLKPKAIWNKAYFDITSEINRMEAGKYQLMISAGSTKGDIVSTQNIYLDNIKIVSRK
jgi:hypothetical protein